MMKTLLDLVAKSASGELVCVGEAAELHVFLQAGKVAWATDSSAPFAFGKHLLEHTSLTKEIFQEVLESCRRDRLPLGETLIAWQVVTLEEIRAALSHQIRGALTTLVAGRDFRTVFLERGRQFASYDTRLTFDVESVLPEEPVRSDHAALIGALMEAVPQAAWWELAVAGRMLVHPTNRVPCSSELARSFAEERANALVLRTGSATYLGTAVGDSDGSVWCALDPEAAFGTIQATIASELGVRGFPASPPPLHSVPVSGAWPQMMGDGTDRLRDFLDRVPEVTGALVIEGGEVSAVVRRGWDVANAKDIVLRRTRLLGVSLPSDDRSGSLESIGYHLRSVAVADGRALCFGAEVGGDAGRSAWIFLDRSGSQGLGWAYLASLRRSLDGANTARQWEPEWNKVG